MYNAIKEIDKVLTWFAKDIDDLGKKEKVYLRQRAAQHEIVTGVIEDNSLDFKYQFVIEINLILEKLIKDGYLIKNGEDSYSITFEGKLFSKQGGYQGESIRQNAENTRVETLEISQQKLMGKLNLLTAWIAGGTIALVLVELAKVLNEILHWW